MSKTHYKVNTFFIVLIKTHYKVNTFFDNLLTSKKKEILIKTSFKKINQNQPKKSKKINQNQPKKKIGWFWLSRPGRFFFPVDVQTHLKGVQTHLKGVQTHVRFHR